MDSLLTRAQIEQDASKQAVFYRKVQEIVFKQLPYVPLWYEDHVFVARNSMKGYVIHADGNYDGLQNVHRTTSESVGNANIIQTHVIKTNEIKN